jgi:hypothetical protein
MSNHLNTTTENFETQLKINHKKFDQINENINDIMINSTKNTK